MRNDTISLKAQQETAYSDRPPRAAYQLTAEGRELAGALRLLAYWAAGHAERDRRRSRSLLPALPDQSPCFGSQTGGLTARCRLPRRGASVPRLKFR
jgi:hypothetical protein